MRNFFYIEVDQRKHQKKRANAEIREKDRRKVISKKQKKRGRSEQDLGEKCARRDALPAMRATRAKQDYTKDREIKTKTVTPAAIRTRGIPYFPRFASRKRIRQTAEKAARIDRKYR